MCLVAGCFNKSAAKNKRCIFLDLKNTLEPKKNTLLRSTLISPRDGWHSQQLQRGTDASGLVSDKTGVSSRIGPACHARVAVLCPQCLWHVNIVNLCCPLQALRGNDCCGEQQDFLRAAALTLLSLLRGIAQSGALPRETGRLPLRLIPAAPKAHRLRLSIKPLSASHSSNRNGQSPAPLAVPGRNPNPWPALE